MHERGVPFIDVDVKWLQKRIPGTHYLSWWNFHFNEALLPKIAGKNQEVVIYSSDERWAPLAVARAVSWGYENVYFFPYGLDKWKAAGYPVDTSR
jgi:rhodanese-related sulfurtransferase